MNETQYNQPPTRKGIYCEVCEHEIHPQDKECLNCVANEYKQIEANQRKIDKYEWLLTKANESIVFARMNKEYYSVFLGGEIIRQQHLQVKTALRNIFERKLNQLN